jgi:8-oxo-dGTP pyrophosphatase MutT (NUDIX family)
MLSRGVPVPDGYADFVVDQAGPPPPRRPVAAASPGGGRQRPGYGIRHPDLAVLLASVRPAATERVVWPGNVVIDVAAYPEPAPVPPDLVTSVRCIVRVDGRVVVCQSPDTRHVWPGGRRQPGETYEMTARREVHEETGWLIDEADLHPLGFLHFRYVDCQPDDHPYPHPDFLQVVYVGRATGRDGRAGEWTDLDGWERSHQLLALPELGDAGLSAVQWAFINTFANDPGMDR